MKAGARAGHEAGSGCGLGRLPQKEDTDGKGMPPTPATIQRLGTKCVFYIHPCGTGLGIKIKYLWMKGQTSSLLHQEWGQGAPKWHLSWAGQHVQGWLCVKAGPGEAWGPIEGQGACGLNLPLSCSPSPESRDWYDGGRGDSYSTPLKSLGF